jgi:signal transduction histidine kinase
LRSLAARLTLAFLAVGLTGAALVALFAGLLTLRAFDRFVLDRAEAQLVESLGAYYEIRGSWQDLDARGGALGGGRWLRRAAAHNHLLLADEAGNVVLGPPGSVGGTVLSEAERARAVPVVADGRTVGYALFGGPMPPPGAASPEAAFLARLRQALVLAALGATAVALLLGLLLARTITRPVQALTAATQAVARGELGGQVAVRGRDELAQLAGAFNRMSADLARARDLRRQMTADIAHDLRTPTAVLLGYTEGLADGSFAGTPEAYRSMHEEAAHLSRLIEDLRTLSLADAGELGLARRPCDPRALLERTAVAHRPLADAKGVALAVEAPADLPPVEADPERMAQVLGNLVANAVRHTPAGGRVTLAAGPAAERSVPLSVEDTGEGIAEADLPHVFDRHYRGDAARRAEDGASGLGLAIARSLVEAQGGTIRAESRPGAGSRFSLTLPRAVGVG